MLQRKVVKRGNHEFSSQRDNYFPLSFSSFFSFYCISEKMDASCTCSSHHFTVHIKQTIILQALKLDSDGQRLFLNKTGEKYSINLKIKKSTCKKLVKPAEEKKKKRQLGNRYCACGKLSLFLISQLVQRSHNSGQRLIIIYLYLAIILDFTDSPDSHYCNGSLTYKRYLRNSLAHRDLGFHFRELNKQVSKWRKTSSRFPPLPPQPLRRLNPGPEFSETQE